MDKCLFKERIYKYIDPEGKRLNRIKRYKEMSNKILDNFSNQLSTFYSKL